MDRLGRCHRSAPFRVVVALPEVSANMASMAVPMEAEMRSAKPHPATVAATTLVCAPTDARGEKHLSFLLKKGMHL